MPPEHRDASDPKEWLRRAKSNLARARADRDVADVLYEDLAFDAQQAAEKAVKAVLVHRQIAFPKTHRITELLTLLEQAGDSIPPEVRECGVLSQYAVDSRYPGLAEDLTEVEYTEAVRLAELVLRWANAAVGERTDKPL